VYHPWTLVVANTSRIVLVDESSDDWLVIDGNGVRFSTAACDYDFDLTILGLLEQLARLTGASCSGQNRHRRSTTHRRLTLRAERGSTFPVRALLKDQCGGLLRSSFPVDVVLAGQACARSDARAGVFSYTCSWPGDTLDRVACTSGVGDALDFIDGGGLDESCVDLGAMVRVLAEGLVPDVLTKPALLAAIDDDEPGRQDAEKAAESFISLFTAATTFLSVDAAPGARSRLQQYIDYATPSRLARAICTSSSSSPTAALALPLSLVMGDHSKDLTTLAAFPDRIDVSHVVQDGAQRACCPNSGACTIGTGKSTRDKWYDANFHVPESGCICGKTSEGQGVAFGSKLCSDYKADCASSNDCPNNGVYVVGSCCGVSICVDPYECSSDGAGKRRRDDGASSLVGGISGLMSGGWQG
jgi:hypothetical protein